MHPLVHFLYLRILTCLSVDTSICSLIFTDRDKIHQSTGQLPRVLQSPYYPESYLPDINQAYQLQAADRHVRLEFSEIILSPGGRYCNDTVTIYDGSTTDAVLGHFHYKSSKVPQMCFVSCNDKLTIKFHSCKYRSQKETGKNTTYLFKVNYTMEDKGTQW